MSSLAPVLQVFWSFLILGLGSFGGPVAHIGYFQRSFVQRKQWLSDSEFSQATALCQFLPGPASSQLGMFIGYRKAGYIGALAAFIGFTFPSAALLTVLAILENRDVQPDWVYQIIQAAKLLAVVVVADALFSMIKKNLIDGLTVCIAAMTAISVFFTYGLIGQLLPILLAAALGVILSFTQQEPSDNTERPSSLGKPNVVILSVFLVLLFGLPYLAALSKEWAVFNNFYQAGSFVFGGGHVVLPLLEPLVQQWVDANTFLSAYASAQLVPGPMFTMASYLGAASLPETAIWGSLLATLAIFLPGSLLLFAFLPAWQSLLQHPRLRLAVKTITASVVGLLAAAWVDPVITSSITRGWDVLILVVGFVLLKRQVPVWCLAMILIGYSFVI
ncbi:chromate efflux transporter [Photobacterium sp. TLY01]|uniref:chromate efflux transporter n=1 Tax=Photobacterium sp. TLY01 TaxID=2907534 RepID=UPI001F4145A1|nr:chromate efflux transporter [Photobacterium sp. TLY01]UIP29918.1 chromate efflux transporter [Photobacterium sp. TLY01]